MIESRMLAQVADLKCKHICSEAIMQMRQNPSELLGDSDSLDNAWEDVCLQVQSEHSIIWELYLESLNACIEYPVTKLQSIYQQAIWLQTEEGQDWLFDNEESQNVPPVLIDDLVEYIRENYVLAEAADYTSDNIEKCKEREMD